MSFISRDRFDEKMAKKSFMLLSRLKIKSPTEAETNCLLCADSPLMFQEIILCTDQSVFYHSRLSSGLNRYDYSAISAVTIENVSSYPSVCLTISSGEKSKLYVAAKDADKMADYIKCHISRSTAATAPSVADEISKFKSLLDAGAITVEEYDLKKKELLGL